MDEKRPEDDTTTKKSLYCYLIDLIYFQSEKKKSSNIRYATNQSVGFDCLLDRQHRDYNAYQIAIVLEYSIGYRLFQQYLCLK